VHLDTERSGVAAALALVVAFGSYLHAQPWTGRIETLSLFLYPAHLALLCDATLGRSGPGRRLRGLLAIASFGLLALQGGFPGMFVGLVEVPVGLWLLRRSSDRRWTASLLLATALAGLGAIAPWVVAVAKEPPPTLTRGTSDIVVVGLRQLLPGGGTLRYSSGSHTSPYPGIVLLMTATAAGWRHRESRFWLALAVTLGFLALGPELRWTPAGPTLAWSPLAWAARIPGWPVKLSGWYRLGALLPPLLAVAAAPMLVRHPRLAWGVVALAILDQQAYVHTPGRPRPVTAVRPGPALATRLADRVALQLPDDNLARLWEQTIPTQARAHHPDKLGVDTPAFDWLQCTLPGATPTFRVAHAACGPAPSSDRTRAELATLAAAGFDDVVLRPGSFQSPGAIDRAAALLTAALGPAEVLDGAVLVWGLRP